jgi:epoxide hydrolase-like predicted phosphatase
MIKAIIFDAAEVYLRGDFVAFVRESCDFLAVDFEELKSKKNLWLNPKLHSGEIDIQTVFEEFFERKLTPNQREIIFGLYDRIYRPDPEIRQLILKLKKSYLTAMLTNSESRYEAIIEKNGWGGIFDVVVYSHKLGIRKPDVKIYRHAAELLDVKPSECLFIDDREDFTEGAKKAGMDSIQFTNRIDLLNEFKKRGIQF